MRQPSRRTRRIAGLAVCLAVLTVAGNRLGRRERPGPAAPAAPPPEPPQAPTTRPRRRARRPIVAGLAIAVLSFSGTAVAPEPVVPERWIPQPAIAVAAARPLPPPAPIRSRHSLRQRPRQRLRRKPRVNPPLSLAERVLRDASIRIYPSGRADIAAGRVDRRVLGALLSLDRLDHGLTVSSPIPGRPPKPKVVDLALSLIGTPYVWRGNAPGGFDCSGFVQYVLGQRGISLPHFSGSQFTIGTPVSLGDVGPGDVVFTRFGANEHGVQLAPNVPGHEGLYIGGGIVVEASHPGDVVKKVSLPDFIAGGQYGIRRYGTGLGTTPTGTGRGGAAGPGLAISMELTRTTDRGAGSATR